MRIEPTATGNPAGGVRAAQAATVRDPTLEAVAVLVADITETGATLRADAALPRDTLVSLGLAGAGRVLARIVGAVPGGMRAEFAVPLDARQMRRLATVDTLAAVATPQRPVSRAATPGTVVAETPDRAAAVLRDVIAPEAALVYGAGGGVPRPAISPPPEKIAAVDPRERMPFGPAPMPRVPVAMPGGGIGWAALLLFAATLVYWLA